MPTRARIAMTLAGKWLLGLLLLFAASAASAQAVQLRSSLEAGPAPELARATGDAGEDWTWLTLRDPNALQAIPIDWHLLVDQTRFERVRVIVTATDGTTQDISLAADGLETSWAPGGVLRFRIEVPGTSVRGLSLGFKNLDDLSLFRKVTAITPQQNALVNARWLLLMGLFSGLLVASFAYKLFFYAGQGQAFQRWYLSWVAVSLAYGLIWTNVAAYAYPGLAGPLAVRIDYVLVSLVVTLGSLFLLSVLEAGRVPKAMRRAVQAISLVCVACGVVAADERLVPAQASDLVLNLALLACVGTTLVAITVAALRGSRVVWIYLAGWSPVIAVFAARAARNFGLVPQSDLVDLSTFAAIAFESLVFSLVVLDRFQSMKQERDVAEASAREMEIEQETLRRAAHSDFLTGLGNRASFHDELRALYRRAPQASGFTLFLIDVDFLKELNDRQGHDAGDALLRHIGGRLAGLVGEHTTCARIGGDEFAILCDEATGDAGRMAEALEGMQDQLWSRYSWSGELSLSIGSASSGGASSPAEIFRQADVALYEAKRLGRGRRQAFDERLRLQIQNEIDLVREAEAGLRRGEFVLYFQPIVELRNGRHVGVEALLRWNHPVRGLLTPEAFACVLTDKETGPGVQKRVLTMAIDELRRRPGFTGTLAVNFTAMDLTGADAAHNVLRQLAAAGVAPSSLCVEVTEGTILGKPGDPGSALQVLHEAGVRIALDDFGTGYASLVHLKEIKVDTLKIDKSFVAGLLREGDESEEIVRAVLALGHGLKKTVIAEGVETVAQLERLRELGCDYAQGYLFGRPAPAFDIEAKFQDAA